MALPSGLPEVVDNDEFISRFLTQSNHYSQAFVKPVAFMPNSKNLRLSVVRHDANPVSESERIAREDFCLPKAYGVAVVLAEDVRLEELEFDANDMPHRHADVINWPWIASDPEWSKAAQKLKAIALAQKAARILFPASADRGAEP